MFKKLSIILICLLMCLSGLPSFAMSLDATVGFDSADIVIDCGAKMAGKMITVLIFEPDSGFSALSSDGGETYTVTDSAAVNKAVSMTYQKRADENGKISFSYKPKGLKGKYYVRVGGEGIYENQTLFFDYVSANEAQSVVDDLVQNNSLAKIEALFEKNENENVYTSYQILGLHNSEFYADFDGADDLKSNVYTNIYNNVRSMTNDEFKAVFEEAVYAELTAGLEGDSLLAFTEKHKTYSGLDQLKAYTDIMSSTDYYTEAVKAKFTEKLEAADVSGKSKTKIAQQTADTLLCAALSKCDSYGIMDKLIREFSDEITAKGGKVSSYKSNSTPLNIARELMALQPFDDLESFASGLNTEIKNAEKSTSTSSSSGGGGGGGGKINTYKTPPTEAVYTEEFGNDVAQESKPNETAGADGFKDLESVEWAKEEISALRKAGVVNGKSSSEFAPNDNVTREEFVKMLTLALGIEINKNADFGFSEVSADDWFSPYVNTAAEKGIVTGYDGRFGVGEAITREDMAVMSYRAMEICGVTLDEEREEHTFEDSISDYAEEAVSALYRAELINGRSAAEFSASSNTTRAEAAKLLYSIMKICGNINA